ncbi:Uncharacterised protein [uncultured archaeon]|nr:Uncharacterised protein [uncultured archaeon]
MRSSKIILTAALILLTTPAIVASASTSLWKFSPVSSVGWYAEDFDASNWTSVPQPYEKQETPSDMYFRGFVDADPSQTSVTLTLYADDCIKELYFDQVIVFNSTECAGCTHCRGMNITLPVSAGKSYHTLAAHVKNNGGPGKFRVETYGASESSSKIQSSTVLLAIALTLLASALFLPAKIMRPHVKVPLIFLAYSFAVMSFLTPLIANFGNWGINDWDQYYFHNAVARRIILQYHQIPLWNPYACGGTIILANPQSLYLTPTFIIILLFGVEYGIKLQILLHYLIGLVGMYLLARRLKMGSAASHLAAFVFVFSSVMSLHLAEGHYTWVAGAWLPWFMYFYVRAAERGLWSVPAAAALLLIYLEGHAYLFIYVCLFVVLYAPLKSLSERSVKPVKLAACILVLCFLLGAVKFIPQLIYARENPRDISDGSGFTWEILSASLLDRYQALGAHAYLGQIWGWHEYGGYVGDIALLLALAAIFRRYNPPLFITLLAILALSFNLNAPFAPWDFLHDHAPFLGNLRNPERLIILVTFILAIFAGEGLRRIESHDRWLAAFIVLFVLADLWVVNGGILSGSFPILPKDIRADPVFRQTVGEGVGERRYSGMYEVFLANHGAADCYDPGGLASHVLPWKTGGVLNESYKGEAYLLDAGKAEVVDFTPNQVTVSVNALARTTLVLNENYHRGWSSDAGSVASYEGRVSVAVPAGVSRVTFVYSLPGFALGAAVSFFSCAGLILFLVHRRVLS